MRRMLMCAAFAIGVGAVGCSNSPTEPEPREPASIDIKFDTGHVASGDSLCTITLFRPVGPPVCLRWVPAP